MKGEITSKKKVGRNELCSCGSGKKYKKCCLDEPRTLLDRFTFTLLEQIKKLDSDIIAAQAYHTGVITAKLQELFGEQTQPVEACDRVEQLLLWVEEQVRPVVAAKPALFWICVDRRFPPAVGIEGEDWQIAAKAQQKHELKTALFHKYGAGTPLNFTTLPDGTFEFDVADSDVVNLFGVLFPYCELIASLPSAYRRVGKGATVRIENIPILITELDPDTEKLTELYDKRRTSNNQTLFLSTGGIGAFQAKSLTMSDAVQKDTWSTLGLFTCSMDAPHKIASLGVVKYPAFSLLEVFLGHFHFIELFDDRLQATVGLSAAQLRRALAAVKRYILLAIKPGSEYTLVTRGMWFVQAQFARSNLIYAYELVAKEEEANTAEAEAVIDRYLEILQGSRNHIDLLMRTGTKAFFGDDSISALDMSIIHDPVFHVLLDLQIDDEMKNIKGTSFEYFLRSMVETGVPHVSLPIPPGRRLRKKDENRVFAEVDLYVQVEDLLFLIDCKAYSVTREYLKGSVRAVKNRWNLVQHWLASSDERAAEIAQYPEGSNYSVPRNVTAIVPLVCSAFVEFIWTDEDRFYLDEAHSVPRVCSVAEIVEVLKGDLSHLRNAAFAYEVHR